MSHARMTHAGMRQGQRRGMLLIIVAGLAALMASICLVFVARARSEINRTNEVHLQVQARLMLAAACSYIQETSRLGWEAMPATANHREAFGWVDVRDGQVGPKTWPLTAGGRDYQPLFDSTRLDAVGRPQWPAIGGVCRNPMHVLRRPPFAISADNVPNAIQNDPSQPLFGLPLLKGTDPADPRTTFKFTTWDDFKSGDLRPRPESAGISWFRLLREGPATFVATCGVGGTQGWKDWAEVSSFGETAEFDNDPGVFQALAGGELRLWYRFEWSPAVEGGAEGSLDGGGKWDRDDLDAREIWTEGLVTSSKVMRLGTNSVNQGGTIQWIQRLKTPPVMW